MKASGFGTIEAIVATALLSLITAGVASTVVLARRIQTDVALERHATQIAIAVIEQIRAGGSGISDSGVPGFVVTGDLSTRNGNAHLLEARVRVTWHDNEPRTLELTTLIAR
jgi:type II secretory pathway pseudopilin PulG